MDIVQLIEKNPITRFNGTYQNRFINKIKASFTEDQQKFLLANFYCYLFCNQKTDYVVNMNDVWKWLGFTEKGTCKKVLVKYFTENIDYKIDSDINNPSSKLQNENIMLNVYTFKKLCLRARTKKAEEIHDIYIKLEEFVYEIVDEESDELRCQLEQKELKIKQIQTNNMLQKHDILLKEFANSGSLVYIVRVKSFENGEYIVKIGESRRGVEARWKEHRTKYEEAIILDCFTVNRSKDFEKFIHEHKSIKSSRVYNLPGHETENELFLVGRNITYNTITDVINQNIKYFNDTFVELEKSRMEIEKLNLIQNNQNFMEYMKQVVNSNLELSRKIDSMSEEIRELKNTIIQNTTRTTNSFSEPLVNIGPRLQKINPETFQLVKVYDTVTQCMTEDRTMKRPSINKAAIENTVYNGFRWCLVDRELDANVVNIQQTKDIIKKSLGYVAKVDMERTCILNVYIDKKTASLKNGYGRSTLDNVVKEGKLYNGFYYLLYNELPEDLRATKPDPVLYRDGVGKFDSTGTMVKEFTCKYECIKTDISEKTLRKALDTGLPCNGYIYKLIGEKLFF